MHWQPLYSPATYWVLITGVIGLLMVARRIAVTQKSKRWILFVLRGGVFLGIVALLLNPIDRRETLLPPEPPAVALLVDCSQSMALGIDQSRLDRTKATIDSVSRSVQSARPLQLPLFRFGNHLAKVPGLKELSATEDGSLLGNALERIPSRLAGIQPQAVVVFSDGAVSPIEQLDKIAAAYRKLNIPVYAMLPQQEELLGDIAITELVIPSRVASGDKATVRAVIESRGYDGERVVVSIRPANRPGAAALATLPITLHDGPTSCELIVTADSSMSELEIQIPILEGEAVGSNNRVQFGLAERDRKLKVLYMEGTMGQEYRWIRDALQEDSDIQCVSMVVNNQYAERPRLQRVDDSYRGFPTTRSELFEYDVVICSDILHSAFTPEQITWTADLVGQRGGGFVMIGGHTSFGSGGWDRTEWEQLIPFDMTGRRDFLNQTFQVEVPPAVESHPIWKLLDDPQQNRAALDAMPPFGGTNLISRVKPAATLLGQTKTPLSSVGIMPIFACQTYGRGRTFAMATDSTAAWGTYFETRWGEGDNRYFRKFWRNVIRWLAENSHASKRRLLLRCDKVIYSKNDPIKIVVEAFDKELKPTTDYRVTASLHGSDNSESDPTASAQLTGTLLDLQPDASLDRYTGTLKAAIPAMNENLTTPMQMARIVVTAWDGDDPIASESIGIQLLHDSKEWLRPQSQPETLRQVAEACGGSLLSSESELATLLASYDPASSEVLTHTIPLWDRAWVWMSLLGLLAVEWTLRRKASAT